MGNGKVTHRKKRKTVLLKLTIALIAMMFILGGTLTVSFANQDLNAMLTSWFDEKRNDAIVHIRDAVSSEKDIQQTRLRAELQKEMAAAESQLKQMTEDEKNRRIQNLRDYTNKLISEITIDHSEEKQQMKNQLDSIYTEAVNALNNANASWKSSVVPGKPAEPAPQPEQPADVAEPAEPAAETPVSPPEAPENPADEETTLPVPPEETVTDAAPEGDGE